MVTVIIGQCDDEFTRLRQAMPRADLLRPRVGNGADNFEHRLYLPAQITKSREYFDSISAEFSNWLQHGEITALVPSIYPYRLNPLLHAGAEGLLAMLILAFPEVRWLFGSIRGYGDSGSDRQLLDEFRSAHGLHNLFHPGPSPRFDGFGLRHWVRHCMVENKESAGDADYLPYRLQSALALDEEISYAHLHAYAAYRFGYRAIAPTTFAQADYLLRAKGDASSPVAEKWDLILEDIYVNFSDSKPGLSKLYKDPQADSGSFKGRAEEWSRLEEARYRIFITSAYSGKQERRRKNLEYIDEQRKLRHIRLLYKPYAGIFRLWERSGLMQVLNEGFADGFVPPLEKKAFLGEHSHSSPGVLLVIAEALIARAKKLLPEVISVEEAVRGAILANDALELLGYRTPTLAVEALRLKHNFELLAECRFSGVEHHLCLNDRLMEIRRDVAAISKWFGPDQMGAAALNAEVQILLELVRTFREFGQFDEENTCLQHVRTLNRQLWFSQTNASTARKAAKERGGRGRGLWWRTRRLYACLIYPFRWYIEVLLSSIPVFLIAIFGWIFLLMTLFWLTGMPADHLAEAAFTAFIGVQPPVLPEHNRTVAIVGMVAGATHLGVFVSHLYTLVSRR